MALGAYYVEYGNAPTYRIQRNQHTSPNKRIPSIMGRFLDYRKPKISQNFESNQTLNY